MEERRYDGFLFIPEYGLLIDSPLCQVDILALGKDPEHSLDALWHCVVNEDLSILAESKNVVPDGQSAKLSYAKTLTIKLQGKPSKVR